ncbi:hypothetical protein CU052_16820 [Vibrio harveyi]|uniref:hypothetical protein n=1 Tax=Vibrio harveyi TaxID=669 RepID=UPI000C7ABC01|nr:hypothetical protein [Vibrio harveyi]AWB00855.1 hypothetical protein CU052_16820 [Vibrio harveyi]
MSLKQAFSFNLYHSSLNKLQRRKSRIEEDFYKSHLFIENGYELVNGDYQEKLVEELRKMIREKKSDAEIEDFEGMFRNPTALESYQEFLSEHKDKDERVLLILDNFGKEREESINVFKEMLNHIDIYTVIDNKIYTDSSQINELKDSLDKAYEYYCLKEAEYRKTFTRKL